MFRLTNPLLPGTGVDYKAYLYDPARDDFGIGHHDTPARGVRQD